MYTCSICIYLLHVFNENNNYEKKYDYRILISTLDPLEYLLSNIHPFLLHALTLKAILNLGMHVKNIISHLN